MSCEAHFVILAPDFDVSICAEKGRAKAFFPKLPLVSEAGIEHGPRNMTDKEFGEGRPSLKKAT